MSRSIVTDRKKSAVNKHWSAKDKVRAVAAFLVAGNMARVCEQTGIPLGTLNFWKTQPWWFEQIEKIRQGEDQEIDDTFTRIVKKTQEIMFDRLENGDFFVDKDGSVLRKPVSMRDAAIVGAIGIDKRAILRQVPQSEQNKVGMQERLKNLETEFTKLVKREKNTIDITPILVEEVDGEQESPGLQEGSGDRDPGTEGSEGSKKSGSDDHGERGESPQGGWEGRGTYHGDLQRGQEHGLQSGDAGPVQEQVI